MPTLRVYHNSEPDGRGHAEARVHMLGDRTELGRSLGSAVHLPEPTVGRHHARIERRGARYLLTDLGSSGGTHLEGGERVRDHALRDRDRFRVGGIDCEFLAAPQASLLALMRTPPRLRLVPDDVQVPLAVTDEGVLGDHKHIRQLRIAGLAPRHARLLCFAGEWWIEALDGAVRLDGLAVLRARLVDGAALTLGEQALRVRVGPLTGPPQSPVLEDIPEPARETRHRLQVFEVDAAPREQSLTGELVVGRGSPSGLQLRSSGVSRRHCRFFVVDGCCFVEDLGSTHGTRVEGRPIAGPCALAHGARVLLQDVLLVYCEAGRPSPPRHGPP